MELRADWVLQMYARNLALMLLVAGGLHLWFYVLKRQGAERKFDPRGQSTNDRRFFARNQVWDNMLWTCASGVTVWTAYEAGFMWAYANDLLPFYLRVDEHPVWFVVTLVMIPFWASLHFYFVHRLLHWRPLYRIAHALHHRNDNVGPWSGLSMHPIEHLIYLSSVLVHVAFASHPIHILFHMQWNTLGAATSHTGFESLTFRGRPIVNPRVVPPPAPPPLLRLQLRESLHALGPVARHRPRRHAAGDGRAAETPARTGPARGRTRVSAAVPVRSAPDSTASQGRQVGLAQRSPT